MAATLTTSFYRHYIEGIQDPDPAWGSPSKIVFTSPNIDDGSPAATRSHVLPELMDIALWYEATDYMFRQTIDQTIPNNIMFQRYGELHTSYVFNSTNNMDLYDSTGSVSEWQPSGQLRYISANSINYSSVSDLGSAHFQFTHSANAGTDTAVSGTKIFLAADYCDVPLTECILYEMQLGEAYNAYLTAWDDDTHTTTDNPVISGSHYRAAVSVFYITGEPEDPYSAEGTAYGTLVGIPNNNVILYGDTSKYTVSGTLKYNAIDSGRGAFLAFRPMLYGMDTAGLTFGSYDFITTLHFQYT